jgi:zinc D-Ala-D-Ala carboxypeptidase
MSAISYPYFSQAELQCRCGCEQAKMQPEFMQKLIALREYLNFPLPVTSAYRCAKHNQVVSSTGVNGPHTTGRAVDIAISGEKAFVLMTAAKQFGFTGIGMKQHGPHGSRYVHLDDLTIARPMVWTYA